MVKQTFLGTIRTMQDDLKGAPQKPLQYPDQSDSVPILPLKKTPEPPHFKPRPIPLPVYHLPTEEAPKPPILKSPPTPPLPQPIPLPSLPPVKPEEIGRAS